MTGTVVCSRWGLKGIPDITSITPGETIIPDNPKNIYKVTIDVMFGDADFYDDFDLEIEEKDRDSVLIPLLNFLKNQVATAYPNGRGGYDRYSSVVKDWNKWFGYDEDSDDDECGLFCDEWPSNWDYGGEGTLDKVRVTYYDKDGVPHYISLS